MRLLVIGLLAALVCALLTITLLGYRQDQHVIRWFPGTGIAGKVDTLGDTPSSVEIDSQRTGDEYTAPVLADGTFIAQLPPGRYAIRLPHEARTVTLDVPSGECLDLVFDYRFPLVVLRVPREGWPIPAIA